MSDKFPIENMFSGNDLEMTASERNNIQTKINITL